MKTMPIMVGGEIASYRDTGLEVELEYFENLKEGITYDEIVEEIGEFTGGVGSGMVWPYYAVDKLYVKMFFTRDENGDYDKLNSMSVYDAKNYLYDIPLHE